MLGWIVLLLALVEGGWLLFDGVHALTTGDYYTPPSGEYAGQLGGWSKLFEAIDVDPRSTLVMGLHVGIGGLWLLAMAAFLKRVPGSRLAMLGCAVLALWYWWIGTALSVIQIVLLMRPSLSQPKQ